MEKFVESLGVFGLGMTIIFLGLAVLIWFIILEKYLVILFQKITKKKIVNKVEIKKDESIEDDTLPDHIKAAIIAAISAYYVNKKDVPEFTVKRIKRLG